MSKGKRQQVILHIGSDKAGSTAIQTHIYGNLDWLGERGIYVPESYFQPGSAHGALFKNWSAERAGILRDELTRQAAAHERILLSYEGLHFFESPELKLLAACLHGYRVRIIFYLREQADVIQTGTLQQIKQGNKTVSLRNQAMQPRLPKTRDYLATIKLWERFFRGLEVDVSLYDRALFRNGNIVSDFFERATGESDGLRVVDHEVNSSLDVPSALALNMLEQRPDFDRRLRREVVSLLLRRIHSNGPGERYFLTGEQVANLRAHYADSNSKLVTKYGVSERLLTAPRNVTRTREVPDGEVRRLLRDIRVTMRAGDYVALMTAGARKGVELRPYLKQGWRGTGEKGARAVGSRSVIALRLPLEENNPFLTEATVWIKGAYRHSLPRETELTLNGQSLGTMDLRRARLRVPLGTLNRNGEILLELKHPTRPGTDATPAQPGKPAGYNLLALTAGIT